MADILHPDDRGGPPPKNFIGYFDFLKSEWETFQWLFREFTTKESRRHMRKMLVLLTISTSLLLLQPTLVARTINGISVHDSKGIVISIGLFVLCAALHHFVAYKEGGEREWVLGLNLCRFDERISELLLSKPLGQHDRHGRLLNYASMDKGKWKTSGLMDLIIFQGLPSLMMCTLSLVGLWYIRPEFGALATLAAVLFCTWSLWLNYQIGYSTHPIEREFRRLNRIRVERWEKVQRVITNGVAKKEIKKLSEQMDATMAKDRTFWSWLIGQHNLRTFSLQRLIATAALAYGSYLVYQGEWEIGYLFPLFAWTETLNSHLLQLSNVERVIGRDIVPVQLMCEALRLEPSFDVYAGKPLVRNGPLKIYFGNVSYSYKDENGKDHPVLRNISFGIAPGEKVALLGPSGAGKTTVMKLLLRYDDPLKGSVLVNNTPLNKLDLVSYMQQVGYIPQLPMILDTTIGENLLYGVSQNIRTRLLTNDACELWELMRALKIDFGPRLDRGLNTLVGHHGLKLSGGQAQRVMIGAAVAKQPRLMVIDEATSSLDSTTEKEVQAGLSEALSQGTTALIVAHRLSTVRNLCNRFIVLKPIEQLTEDENQIEAVAESFEELAKISPTFGQLAHDQGVHV
jgi:ABC-type multidrug transport system fused ATPase/permease subunit